MKCSILEVIAHGRRTHILFVNKTTSLTTLRWQGSGHMEKQETEMKWKLEMETGNGNWKRKWKRNFFTAVVPAKFIPVIPVLSLPLVFALLA